MKTLDTSGSFLNGHCHTIHAWNALEIIWDVFLEVRVPIWKDCRSLLVIISAAPGDMGSQPFSVFSCYLGRLESRHLLGFK